MAQEIYGQRSHRDHILVRDAKEVRHFDSTSTHYSGFKAPASLTANVTFTLQDGDGTANQTMVTNASGILSWHSFASLALDNLASTAVNVTIAPGVDNSIDLGSTSKYFANLFANILKMKSNGQVTSIQGNTTATATVAYKLPPADATISGYVLSSDGAGNLTWISNASVSSFKANWITADGTTKTVTHNLGSTDVVVQLFDKTDGSTIEVDSQVRTDANTLTLTASQAPGAAGWRVLILAV